MIDGSVPMALGNSLMLSGIGMLVVFIELILLAVMIVIISKAVRSLTGKKEAATVPAAAPAPAVAAAPVMAAPVAAPAPVAEYAFAGGIILADVDEPTAATAMAVVSHQSGIPLNHLAFRSIKGVVKLDGIEERDAAVIMALTAHRLQKPLNNLVFKSITKV